MKSVAFDFDGTLVDIKYRQVTLLHTICKSFKVEIDTEQIWRKKRRGLNNISALLEQGIDRDLSVKINQIWRNEIESPFWLSFDRKISKRIDEIRTIRDANFKAYLISARKHPRNLLQQIRSLKLAELFDEVICVNPNSKIVEKAEYLRARKIDLFIGDTEADYQSAQLANVIFCGVSSGQRSPQFLRQTGIINVDCEITDLLRQ